MNIMEKIHRDITIDLWKVFLIPTILYAISADTNTAKKLLRKAKTEILPWILPIWKITATSTTPIRTGIFVNLALSMQMNRCAIVLSGSLWFWIPLALRNKTFINANRQWNDEKREVFINKSKVSHFLQFCDGNSRSRK